MFVAQKSQSMKPYSPIEKLDAVLSVLKHFYDEAVSNTSESGLITINIPDKSLFKITDKTIEMTKGVLVQFDDGSWGQRWKIDGSEISLILDRLFKDGNVLEFTKEHDNVSASLHNQKTYKMYSITFDGLVLYETGGYRQLYADKNRERENDAALKSQIEKREEEIKGIQERAANWTRKATLVALAILIVEFLLLIAAFASIVYDHPNYFPFLWHN